MRVKVEGWFWSVFYCIICVIGGGVAYSTPLCSSFDTTSCWPIHLQADQTDLQHKEAHAFYAAGES